MKTEEVTKVLNFLLQMGIIDIKQYNELLVSSLPFLR